MQCECVRVYVSAYEHCLLCFLGELNLLIERMCLWKRAQSWCLRIRTLANIMCVGKNIVCHEISFSSSFATLKITFIESGVLQPNDFSV